MTTFLVLLVFLAAWTAAATASIRDPQPLRRPRHWTIGSMLQWHRSAGPRPSRRPY